VRPAQRQIGLFLYTRETVHSAQNVQNSPSTPIFERIERIERIERHSVYIEKPPQQDAGLTRAGVLPPLGMERTKPVHAGPFAHRGALFGAPRPDQIVRFLHLIGSSACRGSDRVPLAIIATACRA
jgi:hypothetical protein